MKEQPEALALALLLRIVDIDKQDRDALPGTVVGLVKRAVKILRKRQR